MAEYILKILKTQLIVVFSWGFHNPIRIDNGLRFKVEGFKFTGIVEIFYNEGTDLFDVNFITKTGQVAEFVEGVYLDSLVNMIDNKVERVEEYNKI